jgi:hypothetical protein
MSSLRAADVRFFSRREEADVFSPESFGWRDVEKKSSRCGFAPKDKKRSIRIRFLFIQEKF